MRYLGITNLDSLTDKIDAAASVAITNVGEVQYQILRDGEGIKPNDERESIHALPDSPSHAQAAVRRFRERSEMPLHF
jgi:hypothetical protein